ncbi:hypothetical protein HDU67_007795 [Dinochytrium kinnereticum]|nr:hypothetical protein HDU67_007795 [Dinochytrium kinnereticum]
MSADDASEKYSAIASYKPANPDEIRLSLGEVVSIIQSYDDGWVLGKNEMTMEIGLLPRNFLSANPIATSVPAPASSVGSTLSAPTDEVKPLARVSSLRKEMGGNSNMLPPATATAPTPAAPIAQINPDALSASSSNAKISQKAEMARQDAAKAAPMDAPPTYSPTPSAAPAATLPKVATPAPMAAAPPPSVTGATASSGYGSSTGPSYGSSSAHNYSSSPAYGSSSPAATAPKPVSSTTGGSGSNSSGGYVAASSASVASSAPLSTPLSQLSTASGSSPVTVTGDPTKPPYAHVTQYPIRVIPRTHSPTNSGSGSLLDTSIVSSTSVRSVLSRDELIRKVEDIKRVRAARAKVAANIGCIKISIAGDSGIGKTSLIKKFFTIPEVTYTETFPTYPYATTTRIQDMKASTIPFIALKTGEDPSNIVIVDTPGFGAQVDAVATIDPVVSHHVAKFRDTDEIFERMEKVPNLVRYLSSGTGAHGHVDVCIYGILHRLKPVDLEFMRRLGPVVNLVPVIVKCDTLKPSEISALKVSVLEEIARTRIPIYGFGLQMSELLDLSREGIPGAVPFAISNHAQMTAGAENEFGALKDAILYHHCDDLRQLTAERFVRWRDARIEGDSVRIEAEGRMREAQAVQMAKMQQQREERERSDRMERERAERMERERREREERERATAAQQQAAERQLQEMIRQQSADQENQRKRQMEVNMSSLQQPTLQQQQIPQTHYSQPPPQQPSQFSQQPQQTRYSQPAPGNPMPISLNIGAQQQQAHQQFQQQPPQQFQQQPPSQYGGAPAASPGSLMQGQGQGQGGSKWGGFNKLFAGGSSAGGAQGSSNDASSTYSNDGGSGGKRGFGIIKK